MKVKSNNQSLLFKGLLLFAAFLLYSCEGIFSKLASTQELLSANYITYFICVLAALGAYAILWQKALEHIPLNKAFVCKSMTILLLLAISYFVFDEQVSMNNIIGALFIILGIIVLAWK